MPCQSLNSLLKDIFMTALKNISRLQRETPNCISFYDLLLLAKECVETLLLPFLNFVLYWFFVNFKFHHLFTYSSLFTFDVSMLHFALFLYAVIKI